MKNKIQIYCDRKNLIEIRQFVTEILKSTSLSDIEVNALVLAVDEVCANVIIHSTDCDSNQSLEVFAKIKKNDIIFEVIDNGIGYDLRAHKMPKVNEIIREKRKGGVGLMLVQKIMDEIDFIPGNKGNIIRLIKHI